MNFFLSYSVAGVKALTGQKVYNIDVDDFGSAQSAAEGAHLVAYRYQQFRAADKVKQIPTLKLVPQSSQTNEWKLGQSLAENQNWARTLANTPANHMTPIQFAENVEKNMDRNVKVQAHNKAWIEGQKMGSFLSVSRGSIEPPVFLELTYNGAGDNSQPIALVGKGITFDSGGISLKPSAKMDEMRADMGGGAVVVATINALAQNKARVNIKGFVALSENLPSGSATKPGDVVFTRNGKSIAVDNTDAEGRLVLVDALDYAAEFNPKVIIDMATLTGAMKVALGDCLTGAFCNNELLWHQLEKASVDSGDRVWRMPLFKHFTKQMTGKMHFLNVLLMILLLYYFQYNSFAFCFNFFVHHFGSDFNWFGNNACVTDYEAYDLNNISKSPKGGGSCTAAAFLREFVKKETPWVHLDIAPVMGYTTDQPYLGDGMHGRPLRTVYQLIVQNYQS